MVMGRTAVVVFAIVLAATTTPHQAVAAVVGACKPPAYGAYHCLVGAKGGLRARKFCLFGPDLLFQLHLL